MKWFFAYNGLRPRKFDLHIRAMVRSAVANTSLDPHLLYFGDPDNPIVSFAEGHGVRVIPHSPSILADLERTRAKFPDFHLQGASGAYLRIDLPCVCSDLGFDDQFVLYTDCDVVFLRDLPQAPSESFLEPSVFSVAPETSQTDWTNMSSGVMIMNLVSLLEDFPSFKRFITSGDNLYYEFFKRGAFDQRAYALHYASKWDKLPLEYNWKPYWGYNEDAVIVHFHGPKIPQVREIIQGNYDRIPDVMINLYERNPDSYKSYLAHLEEYTSD
jgi:hypothetical protein